MVTNNFSFKRFVLLVATGIVLFSSKMSPAEISGPELLNLLKQKDDVAKNVGYKISFVAIMRSDYDPNEVMVVIDCEVTYTEGAFAMKETHNYEHPPLFVPPGSPYYQSGAYDNKGRMIRLRPLKRYILSNSERNDLFEELAHFHVDPNGRANKTFTGPALQRYPVGRPYSMHQFRPYRFAMGRDFSRDLGTIKSVKTLSTGLMEVTSEGSHGPTLPGMWELIVDPNSDYLVRKAVFTTNWLDRPTIIVTSNESITKDGIKLAKHGTFSYPGGRYEASIEVTDISKVVGPNLLYEEVVSRVTSPLPPGAQIADCRGKKTIITTVK